MSVDALLDAFNDAFNRHDVDGMMALMTPDCRFENTIPAPDGEVFAGQAAVRAFWEAFFRQSPGARITVEERWRCDGAAVERWRYDWGSGHVRGVDLFRLRDGLIAEKLSYVKG
jgi:hypothetical protein